MSIDRVPQLPTKPAAEMTPVELAQMLTDATYMLAVIDDSFERETSGELTGDWSTYVLRREDTREVIYAGRTRDPAVRLTQHLQMARSPRPRPPVSQLITELLAEGVDIRLHKIGEDMTFLRACESERQLINLLVRAGAPIANVLHTAPPETPTELSRRRYTDSSYRAAELARQALKDIRAGASLTERRREHLEARGGWRLREAQVIIEARGQA